MKPNEHLEDDAELYALGLTDPSRNEQIEAHLAACEACRDRVVQAEAAAAALASALPAMPAVAVAPAPQRRSWFVPGLAAAAALVFATTTAIEGISARSATTQLAQTNTALIAIASSHFGHTTLTSDPGVVAKAIYARDGAWCYVVAEGVGNGAHLVMHQRGTAHDLGALNGRRPATLFVRGAGRVDDVAIVSGGRVVAHGTPAY